MLYLNMILCLEIEHTYVVVLLAMSVCSYQMFYVSLSYVDHSN